MATRNLRQARDGGDLSCDDVFCCVMGFSQTDSLVFSALSKEMGVNELVKATGKSKTRVQCSLNRLVAHGLAGKISAKSKRGRKYLYAPVERSVARKKLLRELESSYRKLKKEISEI